MATEPKRPNELATCKTCGVRMLLVKARSAGPGLVRRLKRCPNCKAEIRTVERIETADQTAPTTIAAVGTTTIRT